MQGIQTKIALNLFVVLLLAVVLLLVVAMIAMQHLLVERKLDEADRIATLTAVLLPVSSTPQALSVTPLSNILAASRVQQLWLHNANRLVRYDLAEAPEPVERRLRQLILRARLAARRQSAVEGPSRPWLSFTGQVLLAAIPIKSDTEAAGVTIGVSLPLDDLQAPMEKLRRLLAMYAIVNAVLFTLVGGFQLRRLTWLPLSRLLRRAGTFRPQQLPIFQPEQAGSEFNQLSQALNHMLQHIADEKDRLSATVASLEEANRELKRTQRDMLRTEKLAGIGRLSSAIAHEIGNPIGIILGYVELLKQTEASEAERSDWLGRMETEIQRINRIIRQLLDVSRSPSEEQRVPVAVHPLLVEVSDLVRYQPFMARIRVQLELLAQQDVVLAESDRLRQVFLNLSINAADAIRLANRGSDGILSIRTQVTPGGQARDALPPADWLEISIADNGCGISEESLPSIFDPFFTTKDPGKGTGLGLYVSFRVLEEMGGTIHATSAPNCGTTMVVRLPLHGESRSDKLAGDMPPCP
jgi:signal transduction histidine kinase